MYIKKSTFIIISILLLRLSTFSQINTENFKAGFDNAFIENKGQILNQNNNPNKDVLFLLNKPFYKVQLRNTGFSYDTYVNLESDKEEEIKLKFHRVDIEFLNSNQNCEIIPQEKTKDYLNYFDKNIPNKQVYKVNRYKKVIYKNLYNKIDLEFIISNNKFKYNFIVQPGGNIKDIKWKYNGAEKIELNNNKIELTLSTNNLYEEIPESFYKNEKENKLNISYKKIGNKTFEFNGLESIHKSKTLIIDPIPEIMWATYLGGGSSSSYLDYTRPINVDVDLNDNIYVSGVTSSGLNITTSGTYQTVFSGSGPGFFAKFNKNGARIYSSLHSGFRQSKIEHNNFDDFVTYTKRKYGNISCDNNGNIVISGRAIQDSLSTTGAFQQIFHDDVALISKFDSTGVLIWATYFGYIGINYGSQEYYTSIDNNNNIIINGYSTFGYPQVITSGAYQTGQEPQINGGKGILAKFNTNGNIIWGTYVASNDRTKILSNCVDDSDNIYISGMTQGDIYITTSGTYMSNHPGFNSADVGFMMKFDSTGNKIWGTYNGITSNGGSGNIALLDIIYDSGYLYFAGHTDAYIENYDSLSTAGAYQTLMGGGWSDGFLTKFDTTGNRIWATYYGGMEDDAIIEIEKDSQGNIIAIGVTDSDDNISDSLNVLQASKKGEIDGFIAKFSPAGQKLYSTYYGGKSNGRCYDLAIDSYNKYIISSIVINDSSFHTNANSFQQYPLTSDTTTEIGHIAKLSDCELSDVPNVIISDSSVCPGDSVTFNISGQLNDASHWAVYKAGQLIGSTTDSIKIAVNDTIEFKIKGEGNCVDKSDAAYVKIYLDSLPIVNAGPDIDVCKGNSVNLNAGGNASYYQWSNGVANGSSFVPDDSLTLLLRGENSFGCENFDTLNIAVNPIPDVNYYSTFDTVCKNHPPTLLSGGTPAGGIYSGAGVYNNIIYPDSLNTGSHQIIYQYQNSYGCSSSAIDFIFVDNCLSLEEKNKLKQINIYPNPGNDFIYIDLNFKTTDYNLKIYNTKGKEIYNKKITNSKQKIDLSNYSSGLYYYLIYNNMDKIRGSFIKM